MHWSEPCEWEGAPRMGAPVARWWEGGKWNEASGGRLVSVPCPGSVRLQAMGSVIE